MRDELSEIKRLLLQMAQAQAQTALSTPVQQEPIAGPSGLPPPSKKTKPGPKKGKGRGKASSNNSFVVIDPPPNSPPSTRRKSGVFAAAMAAAGKMFSSDDDDDEDYIPDDDSIASSHRSARSPEIVREVPGSLIASATYYIKKFQLDINGSPVDQVKMLQIFTHLIDIELKNVMS